MRTRQLLQSARRRTAAFTLIEMLVVIAIISILASMLSPALRNAYNMGLSTCCKNNLHQMYFLMHQYIEDYNDVLPSAYMLDKPSDTAKKNPWLTPMVFYSGMIDENTLTKYRSWAWQNRNSSGCGIFRCPADDTVASDNLYYANYGFSGGRETDSDPVSLDYARLSRIVSPSKVCMLSDCYRNNEKVDNAKNCLYYLYITGSPLSMTGAITQSTDHQYGKNILHVDGGVKWYSNDTILEKKVQWKSESFIYKKGAK